MNFSRIKKSRNKQGSCSGNQVHDCDCVDPVSTDKQIRTLMLDSQNARLKGIPLQTMRAGARET